MSDFTPEELAEYSLIADVSAFVRTLENTLESALIAVDAAADSSIKIRHMVNELESADYDQYVGVFNETTSTLEELQDMIDDDMQPNANIYKSACDVLMLQQLTSRLSGDGDLDDAYAVLMKPDDVKSMLGSSSAFVSQCDQLVSTVLDAMSDFEADTSDDDIVRHETNLVDWFEQLEADLTETQICSQNLARLDEYEGAIDDLAKLVVEKREAK